LTVRERRIKELENTIIGILEELGTEGEPRKLNICSLTEQQNRLYDEIDDPESEIDERRAIVDNLSDLIIAEGEIRKLDPVYIPAKCKPRNEVSLARFDCHA
jgi:hypothetical protein